MITEEILPSKPRSSEEVVASYEHQLALLVNLEHVIAFSYARTALCAILSAAGLRPGDEVILSSLTCKVIPLALFALDLKPVYVDISADTLNLDPIRVEEAIGPSTRSILFQHTYGNSAGVEAITELTSRENLLMIEDCAQCLPYANGSRNPGSWGRAAIFSNNLRKPLPAGSGGVAVTNDKELAQKILNIRDGLPHRSKMAELMLILEVLVHKHVLRPALYWPLFELSRKFKSSYGVGSLEAETRNEVTGEAFQISDYQAREGSRWLAQVEDNVNHSKACCSDYATAFRSADGIKVPYRWKSEPLYYFPIMVEKKEELLTKAREKYIELISWPTKTPIFPIEEERDLPTYGYTPGTCLVAEEIASELIGLPTHRQIDLKERNKTIDFLRSFNS